MASAIAGRYAAALADVVAKSSADLSPAAAMEQLTAFSRAVHSSAELRGVLASPAVPLVRKRALVAAVGERVGLSAPVRNLIFVLLNNGRVKFLDEIIEAVGERFDEMRGIERVEVASAAELDEAQRGGIEQKFARSSGKTVAASYRVDPELLAGVVARRGNTVYDGSLISRLRELGRAMARR